MISSGHMKIIYPMILRDNDDHYICRFDHDSRVQRALVGPSIVAANGHVDYHGKPCKLEFSSDHRK
jgi:hypothetical protein